MRRLRQVMEGNGCSFEYFESWYNNFLKNLRLKVFYPYFLVSKVLVWEGKCEVAGSLRIIPCVEADIMHST